MIVSRCFVANPYTTAWYLRGMENLLADYLTNPDPVEALYDRIWPFAAEILRRATLSGVDMTAIEGDIAMQDRIIVGPERRRRIDKPSLEAMVRACRAIDPDVYVFFHSDGDPAEIMEDLIEIGFQLIDSIQPECMEPARTKVRLGSRCTLHGCGSLQRVLPFGTPGDCREQVRALVECCGRNRRHEDELPVNPEVGVLRLLAEAGPGCLYMTYTCHAVVLGPDNLLVSADYPGYAMRLVDRAMGPGMCVMFANGAAGNDPDAEGSGQLAVEVQAVRIGATLLLAVPLELFVEVGLAAKRRLPSGRTWVLGYSNGGAAYLPSLEACGHGGYQVVSSRFAPESASMIEEAMMSLASSLD